MGSVVKGGPHNGTQPAAKLAEKIGELAASQLEPMLKGGIVW